MNYEDVQKVSNAAKNKIGLLNTNFLKYFLRAVMAGFFIDVAVIYSNVAGNVFSGSDPAWGKFLGALVFSIAVLLISLVGGELFTGNNLVMAFGAFDKKISWGDAAKVWVVSYIGNCLGVLCGIKLKSEAAKFLMIVMCISGFVVSGFEHCVANMGIFVTAGCLVPGVSIGAMVKSMIIVTLGNMAGGALLLAWPLRKMSADK